MATGGGMPTYSEQLLDFERRVTKLELVLEAHVERAEQRHAELQAQNKALLEELQRLRESLAGVVGKREDSAEGSIRIRPEGVARWVRVLVPILIGAATGYGAKVAEQTITEPTETAP